MTTQTSPTTGRPYPLTMVCTVFRVPRATVYAQTAVTVADAPGKRGPHTTGSDADLVAAIRTVLAETPFHGEGHRVPIPLDPHVIGSRLRRDAVRARRRRRRPDAVIERHLRMRLGRQCQRQCHDR